MIQRFLTPALAILLCWHAQAGAQPPLPQYDQQQHLGAETCAASTCHGAVKPWQTSTVLQNEYLTWSQHDPHARAYEVLFSAQSRQIAGKLGIGPAHRADLCLDCHADNVPEDRRGRNFRIEDGVTCEACHGGAQDWLGQHIAGTGNHSDNLAEGMYPTDQPAARARLCLSCHFGGEDKFLNHRLMGAGHPRASFELDTFTVSQPAHFVADEDYRKRKHQTTPIRNWAIGQAVAAEAMLNALLSPKRNHAGIFPELVLFDCHACHHPMSDMRWQPRDGGLAPGTPPLNDSSLVMLRVAAGLLDSALADQVRAQTLALHQASQRGHNQTQAAARQLRDSARQLAARFDDRGFGEHQLLQAIRALIDEGRSGTYAGYIAAEQAVMALATLVDDAEQRGLLDANQVRQGRAALEKAYAATQRDEAYQSARLLRALDALAVAIN